MSGSIAKRMDAAWVWRLVAVASLIVASLAVAYSIGRAQPAPPPEIEACVNKFTGLARMSPTGNTLNCQPHEKLRTWNAAGVPGAGGVSGYEIVSETLSLAVVSNNAQGSATCPTDKEVVGGGVNLLQPGWKIVQSQPINDRSWFARAIGPIELPPGTGIVEVDAVCVDVTE